MSKGKPEKKVEDQPQEESKVLPQVQPSQKVAPKLTKIVAHTGNATVKNPNGCTTVSMNRVVAEKFVRKNAHLGYKIID